MSRYEYILVDVFTDQAFGGNQLAVFPDAQGLSDQQMQTLANELNLAETTFVWPPQTTDNDFRVRIFTTVLEMPMAGHPTIGTAYVLTRLGRISTTEVNFEEQVGQIPVKIRFENQLPVFCQMAQPKPKFGPIITDRSAVAEMLSLKISDIVADLPVQIMSCGVPYMIVPLKSLEAVRRSNLRTEILERILKQNNTVAEVYLFTLGGETAGAQLHSRMLYVANGVSVEDAATGSASGPLGCYVAHYNLFGTSPRLQLLNEQGFEMNRPSLIHIEIEQAAGQINAVRVGGQSYLMGGGYFDLEQG